MKKDTSEDRVRRQNRFFIIAIIVILLVLILEVIRTGEYKDLVIIDIIAVLFILLFAVSAYLRMYSIYKLEKFQQKHDYPSFADFFNKTINKRYDLILLIFPYLTNLGDGKLEAIRSQINLFTLMTYIFGLASLLLTYVINK